MEGIKWTFEKDQDAEYWRYDKFDTKEEAIKEGKKYAEEYGWDTLFIAKCRKAKLPLNAIDGEYMLEILIEALYDRIGDNVEGWYENISEDDKKELEEMIRVAIKKWADKTGNNPDCYEIVDIEEIKL